MYRATVKICNFDAPKILKSGASAPLAPFLHGPGSIILELLTTMSQYHGH